MTSPTVRDVIRAALRYQGAPYVWRGKGVHVWTPQGLAPNPWALPVFDCSGLVTVAIRDAGGPDWRASRNAQALMASLPSCDPWAFGALRFYGRGGAADHVAFSFREGYVLEAAGGDSTTTSPAEAAKRLNARVRVNEDRRTDFLGAAVLPFNP